MKVTPPDGMTFEGPQFEKDLTILIEEIKPKQVIETGTFLGTGSTRILAKALQKIPGSKLFTIESNPEHYAQAVSNLINFPNVLVLNGYSIPKELLPTKEQISEWLDHLEKEDIYVDFALHERLDCYMREGRFDVPDDYLRICMRYFGYRPDLILLDSSGHLGLIEFTYVLSMLKAPCHFVLDDVFHVKHFESLKFMQSSDQFNVIRVSLEKFGYCIYEYLGG